MNKKAAVRISFDEFAAALTPPAGFRYDAEAKRMFDVVTYQGPTARGEGENAPGAFSQWTPERGFGFTFDVLDGRTYTLDETKEFAVELLKACMRCEGIDPCQDDAATT